MMCSFCNTDNLKPIETIYERTIKGKKIIVQNVPALYCDECGDFYFDNKTVKLIKKNIINKVQRSDTIEMHDFERVN